MKTTNSKSRRWSTAVLACAVLSVCALALEAAPAGAQAGWGLDAFNKPTYLRPSGRGIVVIRPLNVGASSSEGVVTVTDVLPAGVTATVAGTFHGLTEVGPQEAQPIFEPGSQELWNCSGDGPEGAVAGAKTVTCVNNPELLPSLTGGGGTPTFEAGEGFADPELAIGVRAPASEGTLGEPNRVAIAGGGAPNATSTREPITVSSTPPPFGFSRVDAWFTNENGSVDTQAGSHPYEATFVTDFNMELSNEVPQATSGGMVRNLTFNLPPGFVGDPNAVPRCPLAQFIRLECPAESQVGVIAPEVLGGNLFGSTYLHTGTPVFNLVPPPGEPAEFGFQLSGVPTYLGTQVRSGSDYALRSQVNNIPQREVTGSVLTLWGEPENPSHAQWHVGKATSGPERPFLTLPTSCQGPQEFSASLNSWEHPNQFSHASFVTHDANDEPAGFTGCEKLAFDPSIAVRPDTGQADHPAGLTVEVKPPVGGLTSPAGLSTANIQDTTVTLPTGLVINPGQAAGLQVCPEGRPGPGRPGDALTTPEERAGGEEDDEASQCPGASKVGEVEIETPLLEHALKGGVFVLPSDPPELKLLVAASGEGVNVKLVGAVHLDERTGQVTTKFEGTPELPFTDFRLSFSGGAQAALATPVRCGAYGPEQGFAADFTPWSNPFTPDFLPSAEFALSEGPEHGACPSDPLPFAPELIAGATSDEAGGYTGFSMLLRRGDGQQRIERLQFHAPPGLSGMLAAVPLCGEPQAAQGSCPAASQIGHASVASGPGPYPLVIPQPGNPESPIYLTGPYGGAPFGLTIVTHVLAGPFDLGTIVTRAKIEVDPHTAQITVTTDPLPQVVAGVPTDLRLVDAVIDRPGFMFNPTNCDPSSFSGTAWGAPPPGADGPGTTAAIASRFQVGACRSLQFKPGFQAHTSAKTSRIGGASLSVKLAYPASREPGQATDQANIASVKVELPKQLPSRLSTLQKACTAAQFQANPAGCPAASAVGHAVVHTPLLPVPLEGPAYFVSNGGQAFPNLIMVLQGYGVTVDLVGDTFISKNGITSSTFKATPDVPFSTFELTLPEGPYSALAANGSLCKPKLAMPTTIVGQNGAQIKQSTRIQVAGCTRAKHRGKHARQTRARRGREGTKR